MRKRFGRNRYTIYTSGQENFWNCLSCRRVTRGGKKSRDGEKKKGRKRQLFWSELFRCAFHDGSRNSPLVGATWLCDRAEWEQGDEEDVQREGANLKLLGELPARPNEHLCPPLPADLL